MKPTDKLERAKIALLWDEPFFGALLLNLTAKEDLAGSVTKTMATDGQSLWWHPRFINALTEPQIKTVLAHEVLHAALLHPLRRQSREMARWNQAADHCINLELESCNQAAANVGKPKPFPWPDMPGILKDPKFAGMSAEEIYGQLQSGPGTNDQGMGGVLDGPADPSAQQD